MPHRGGQVHGDLGPEGRMTALARSLRERLYFSSFRVVLRRLGTNRVLGLRRCPAFPRVAASIPP